MEVAMDIVICGDCGGGYDETEFACPDCDPGWQTINEDEWD